MIRTALPAAALSLGLAGCAASPPLAEGIPPGLPRTLELRDTPFFPQKEFQCGPAALATVLAASGVAVEPDALAPQVFLPGRNGSLQAELIGASRRHGRLAYVLPAIGDALLAELADGRPVLLLQNLGVKQIPRWHYAVLVGYDTDRNVAILRSGRRQRQEVRWQHFARTWDRAGRWAMTTIAPGVIPLAGGTVAIPGGGRRHRSGRQSARPRRSPTMPRSRAGRRNRSPGWAAAMSRMPTGDRAAAASAWARAVTSRAR